MSRCRPERTIRRQSARPSCHSIRTRQALATAWPVVDHAGDGGGAVALGWAMWTAYMGAPWTRDGTVRAYVVTMAPEVAGRIVALPVADNQFVHKGDLLMVIDPTDYKIAVGLAEAAVQQAQANAQNAEREAGAGRS